MITSGKHIAERLKSKDFRGAFDDIVTLYGERMYWHIRRLVFSHDDADDVLQNCYIKMWKGLPKFRYDSEVFTWIYRIVINESRKRPQMERVHRFEHPRSRHKIKQLLWLSTIKVIESLPSPTHTGCIGGSQSLPMPTSSSVPEMLVKVSILTICRTSSPGTRLFPLSSGSSFPATTTASSIRSRHERGI